MTTSDGGRVDPRGAKIYQRVSRTILKSVTRNKRRSLLYALITRRLLVKSPTLLVTCSRKN